MGRFKPYADRTITFIHDESWDGQDTSLGPPYQRPEYDTRPFLEDLFLKSNMTKVIWEREYHISGGNVLEMLVIMGKGVLEVIQSTSPGCPLAQNLSDRIVPLFGR